MIASFIVKFLKSLPPKTETFRFIFTALHEAQWDVRFELF
jgi:hypothetical protein